MVNKMECSWLSALQVGLNSLCSSFQQQQGENLEQEATQQCHTADLILRTFTAS